MSKTRLDGYYNALFGQGFKQTDPFSHYAQGINFVNDEQCSCLYAYNGIAKNIIDIKIIVIYITIWYYYCVLSLLD